MLDEYHLVEPMRVIYLGILV